MLEDREIWACANQLLNQHGAKAWFVASQHAGDLFAAGELEGHCTSVLILSRIGQLESFELAATVN